MWLNLAMVEGFDHVVALTNINKSLIFLSLSRQDYHNFLKKISNKLNRIKINYLFSPGKP